MTAESAVQEFFHAIRRAIRMVALYPVGHPLTAEALEHAGAAVRKLADKEPDTETLLSIRDDAFYLNRAILAHTTLEYNSLLRMMQNRGIVSITIIAPVSESDLSDFVMFVAASSDDLPAEGTIRINAVPLSDADFDGDPLSYLRRSYAGSLETLRSATEAMAKEGAFELRPVMEAVEHLLDNSLNHAGAAILLSTVKSHDEYTFYHSVNTCLLSLSMGRILGLSREELVALGAGAVLHDIGKVAVSRAILNHPGRLTRDQWREMTVHPQEGSEAILAAAGPGHEIAASIALEHHARNDGIGYPRISRVKRPRSYARLVSVADVYDAVTSRRAYRRAETPNRALQVLLGSAGKAHDPDMVRTFIRMMGVYPPGSILRLTDGALMVVTHHAGDDIRELDGVIVRSAAGEDIDPEPTTVPVSRVVNQVLSERAGVDPAGLLEKAGVAHLLFTERASIDKDSQLARAGVDERLLKDQAASALAALLGKAG